MSSVRTVLLKELCNFEKGSTGLMKAAPGEYPLVTTGVERRTCESYQFDTKAVCIPLVSSTGHGHASLNNVHYQEGKFALGTILVALTAKNREEIDMHFLHLYLFQLKDVILVPLMKGAANVSLSITAIKGVEIPLPSIDRQREIVKKFKSIVEEERALLKEISLQKSLLTTARQQILHEALEGKLTRDWRSCDQNLSSGKSLLNDVQNIKDQLNIKKKSSPVQDNEKLFDLPEKWEWCRIEDIAKVGTGATPLTTDPSYYNGDINWMTSGDTGKEFVVQTKSLITEKAIKETNCTVYPPGTLVVAMYGQGKTRGQVTELKIHSATNQACAVISLFLESTQFNQYVKLHFKKIYHQIREQAQGGAQPNLNLGKIKANVIALPPLSEQIVIVEKVKKIEELITRLEERTFDNNIYTEKLMKTILLEEFAFKGL